MAFLRQENIGRDEGISPFSPEGGFPPLFEGAETGDIEFLHLHNHPAYLMNQATSKNTGQSVCNMLQARSEKPDRGSSFNPVHFMTLIARPGSVFQVR